MWRDVLIALISRSAIARWAPIPLRLIVGYGFMEHGFAKLARGLDAFPAILQALGVPAPHLMGWLTILVEIVGGLAVLLRAGTARQHTDGGGSPGRDDYRASALRVQFDQAPGCNGCRRAVRSAGL
jgi:DoxX